MAPVEFEKELKKRLRSREIHPGEDAWDRIASRLDAEGPAPRHRPRWWVGLAAACIALLVSLTFFWDRTEPLPVVQPVVETPAVLSPGPEGLQGMPSTTLSTDAGQEGTAGGTGVKKPKISQPGQVSAPLASKLDMGEPGAASLATMAPSEGAGRVDLPVDRLPDTTAAPAVAMSNQDGPVGDARIDSLLREAQKAIAARDTTQAAASLDASVLLAQAEEELDQTFREHMIQKLREGYNRMRQSVAARKQ